MGIYDYDKDAKPKMSQEERDAMMKKFLDKGGKVQKLQPGAAAVLESSLQRCCTPGKCGSQPMDVASVRMLARLYLEDRVAPERTNELLQDLKKHVQSPTWEDQYISALHARNSAQPFAPQLANQLLRQLSPNDPRRGWVERAFSASV